AEQAHVLEAVVRAVGSYRPGASTDDVLRAIDACNHDASADSYWTLDPVDGTKGFLRGQQYAIALALIERGRVTVGVMGCPNLPLNHASPLDRADTEGCMYAAVRGGGAYEHRLSGAKADASPARIQAAPWDSHRPIRACESVE